MFAYIYSTIRHEKGGRHLCFCRKTKSCFVFNLANMHFFSHALVKRQGMYYVVSMSIYLSVCLLDFHVSFVSPSWIEDFFLNFTQMSAIPRSCTELINKSCPIKVKVTLQGQSSNGNISWPLYNFKTFYDFFMKLTNVRHD